MKRVVLVTAVLAGCVHAPALTPREQCGTQGMVVEGVAMSSGSDVTVATNLRTTAVARTNSYSETALCRRPATPEETCEARASGASAVEKLGYSPGWRNVLIGVGYVFWILPGLVLFVVFDSQYDNTITDAEGARLTAQQQCEFERRHP